MTGYQMKLPQAVYGGIGALAELKTVLGAARKKAAVFTDQGIRKAGLLERPLAYIREAGVEAVILDQLPAEPTCDQAQAIVDEFKQSGADVIIAVGGGSVMDIAKLASILNTDEYGVRDLLENPLLGKKQVPTVMIPTTAGTGSEATPNSIVAVPEKELKVGIVNPEMIADAVILDAEMIKKLPRSIAAATGIDALAHAIECYTSKKANPFSDTFALEALELIMNNIEQACDAPEALEAKSAMLTAAFYAGIAITASGTTAVHALSYPLGGKYHIPHGVSNAMMLVPVMKFNEPMCRERFAAAYDRVTMREQAVMQEQAAIQEQAVMRKDALDRTAACGGVASGQVSSLSTAEKSAWLIRRLDEIVHHLDIPQSLAEFGVPPTDLDVLVASGMEVQRLLVNNRRTVTPDDARALYLEIM